MAEDNDVLRLRDAFRGALNMVEVLPMTSQEFDRTKVRSVEVVGVPVFYDVEKIRAALWPLPAKGVRLFVVLDTDIKTD